MARVLRVSAMGARRPGALVSFCELLAEHRAELLDIGESVEERVQALGLVAALAVDADLPALIDRIAAHSAAISWQAAVEEIDEDGYEAQRAHEDAEAHRLMILARRLPAALLARVAGLVEDHGLSVAHVERVTARRSLREGGKGRHIGVILHLHGVATAPDDLRARLLAVSDEDDVDLAFQLAGPPSGLPCLAVFDMDSTLITCECIDELAAVAGSGEEVAAITAAAMRGELDFAESFRRRLATLADLPSTAIDELAQRLPYTPGIERMVRGFKRIGCRLGILSGGFTQVARVIQDRFGFDVVHGNELEVVDGRLTGRHVGPIVDGPRKAHLLTELAEHYRIPLAATVAVGDGANDLPMLSTAGIGIAFHGKPALRAQAQHSLSNVGLDGVLTLLGIRDGEDDHGTI